MFFREGGLLAAHQGWPLACCFCAASELLFRVELCAFVSFLADPASLASFGCPHRALLCSGPLSSTALLSLPFCLRVRGRNYDLFFWAAALALLLECSRVVFFVKGGSPEF